MTDLAEPVDAEVVEDAPRALATVPQPPALAVTPNVQAGELVARLDVIKQAMTNAMQDGVDYGRIPGVDKPTLLKPGAEKLGVLFQLDVQLVNEKDWHGDHLTVTSKATVYHAPTGARLGFGEGLCSSREKKYGKRTADRHCPQCEAPAIKRSKFPPREDPSAEPGWYCFAKVGGCGANFAADDARITGQTTGEVENPDLPDTWNTVLKMAEKRARVDAVLAVTGASALFTQDAEDMPDKPPVDQPTSQISVASPAQKKKLRAEITRSKADAATMTGLFTELGVTVRDGEKINDAIEHLSPSHASQLIDRLLKGAIPNGKSDVPAPGTDDFQHPEIEPDDRTFEVGPS